MTNGNPRHLIKDRVRIGFQTYFTNRKVFENKFITRKTKHTLYKTLIRSLVIQGCENWTLNQEEIYLLRSFEYWVIRNIYYGWRMRNNKEVDKILKHEDIVRFIKAKRIRWFGHVLRMQNDREPKMLLLRGFYGTTRKVEPRQIWITQVEEDLQNMHMIRWGIQLKNRLAWRRIVKKAKVHTGL